MASNKTNDYLELAAKSVQWITQYTGEGMYYLSGKEKSAAIKAFRSCVDMITKDALGNPLDLEAQEDNIDAANEAIEWITTYGGKGMYYLSENEKAEAISAFHRCADMVVKDAAGNLLVSDVRDDNADAANEAIGWITAYTGEGMYYLSEKEKATAIKAFRSCVDMITKDASGNPLDLEAQEDNIDAANEAIEWITKYTGDSIRYANEAQKSNAINAFLRISKQTQRDSSRDYKEALKKKDQEIESLKKKLSSQKQEAEKAGQIIAEAEKTLRSAKETAGVEIRTANEEAKRIISDANARAASIVSRAREEAADIVAQANRATEHLAHDNENTTDSLTLKCDSRAEQNAISTKGRIVSPEAEIIQQKPNEDGFWF